MKLSKQELKQRISDAIKDNDELVISILEDIEDSMNETNEAIIDETKLKELEELQYKYNDLLTRYKERFLSNENIDEGKNEEQDELEEKNVVDIKEI